jgi:hypothetical protein
MNFRIYNNGQDFLIEAEDFIKNKEALNNLIYSLAESNLSVSSGNDKPPLFFSIKDDNQVRMGAVMTPPYRLVIYAEGINDELFKFAIHNIMENRIELPGVLGPNDCAVNFLKSGNKRVQDHIRSQ